MVIPASHADLLSREKRAFAALALVTRKGEPHVTPMWFDFDGEHVIFNTARGRLKDRVLHRRPVVALAIADRAVFLEKGQVRFEGPAQELAERGDLVRAVFLGTEGG